jgi:hypothetical protein
MFKYVKFERVETEFTTLEFRGGNEDVIVHNFDVDVVSIESESEVHIDALIEQQAVYITVQELTHDEFKSLVSESAQINRIRDIVKSEISKKYTVADEIAMMKRDVTDLKRVAYETYVQECIAYGDALKAEVGY